MNRKDVERMKVALSEGVMLCKLQYVELVEYALELEARLQIAEILSLMARQSEVKAASEFGSSGGGGAVGSSGGGGAVGSSGGGGAVGSSGDGGAVGSSGDGGWPGAKFNYGTDGFEKVKGPTVSGTVNADGKFSVKWDADKEGVRPTNYDQVSTGL